MVIPLSYGMIIGILLDSCLNSETKVNQIVDAESWKRPTPNSWELRELISSTPCSCNPNPSRSDQPVWKLNPDGKFTINSAWNHWRYKCDKVTWHKLLWGPHMIPRVSFIVWIALHERLNTDLVKSHSHLFFNCMFSARVWSALKTKCNVNWPDLHRPNLITLAIKETKGRSLRSHILRLSLLCSIYHIWLERIIGFLIRIQS
ncbi:hypothetical protein ACSBR1_041736 [Camellia fascicularis]